MSSTTRLRIQTERPTRIPTMADDDNSQLLPHMLRLPSELRLQIFEHAYAQFTFRAVVEITSADLDQLVTPVGEPTASDRSVSAARLATATKKLQPAQSANACLGIPLTCRLFAKESLPILYRRTLFHVHIVPNLDYFTRKRNAKARRPIDGVLLHSIEKYRIYLHMDDEADVAPVLKSLRSLIATMRASGRPLPSSMSFPLCSHPHRFEPGSADDLLGVFLPSSLSLPLLGIDDPVQHVFSNAAVKAFESEPEGPYLFVMSGIEW